MAKDKRSFFERLTGGTNADDSFDDFMDEQEAPRRSVPRSAAAPQVTHDLQEDFEEETSDGQLTVDVYQTPDNIVIKTMVAGVSPSDLDVSITRDMVTIRGSRATERSVNEEDYFHKELYWGSFSRTILLPQEIEVEEAEAIEKHGLLILTLPKIDKARQTKLRVKSG